MSSKPRASKGASYATKGNGSDESSSDRVTPTANNLLDRAISELEQLPDDEFDRDSKVDIKIDLGHHRPTEAHATVLPKRPSLRPSLRPARDALNNASGVTKAIAIIAALGTAIAAVLQAMK